MMCGLVCTVFGDDGNKIREAGMDQLTNTFYTL